MKHPTDDQLIAFYYGEHSKNDDMKEHLRDCVSCHENFKSLQRTLTAFKDAPIPERDAEYGSQVWFAIAQRLDAIDKPQRHLHSSWAGIRRLAAVGALAAAIALAFFAGRYWPRTPIQTASTNPSQIRQSVLLIAVSDHLDHAQMMLMELANADGTNAKNGATANTVNISDEQERAKELLASNRLYQQTAQQTGNAELENILNALDPVLLQIAHSGGTVSSQQFQEIQQRINDAGILFEVRIVSSHVHEKEKSLARQSGQGRT